MKKCAFCNQRYTIGSKLSFHRFPTDLGQRSKWLSNMGVGNWTPKKYQFLCSKHFDIKCFEKHDSRTVLILGSVPTIFEEPPEETPNPSIFKSGKTDYFPPEPRTSPENNIILSKSVLDDHVQKGLKEPQIDLLYSRRRHYDHTYVKTELLKGTESKEKELKKLEEDLENYHYWKLMKGSPRLKSAAKLRLNITSNFQSDSKDVINTTIGEVSELQSLLLQPIKVILYKAHTCKPKKALHSTEPTATSTSTCLVTNPAQACPSPSAPKQKCTGLDDIENSNITEDFETYSNQNKDSNFGCDIPSDGESDPEDEVEFLDEDELSGDLQHWDCVCNICDEPVVGFRYTCLQCADWDMCAACEARGAHPHHYVLRLPAPPEHTDNRQIIQAVGKLVQDLLNVKKEIEEIYFKEEVKEEMPDSFTQDMYDPLPDEHETYVPEDSMHLEQMDTEATSTSAKQYVCANNSRTNQKSRSEYPEVPKSEKVQNPRRVPNTKPKRFVLKGCKIPDKSVKKAPTSLVPSNSTVQHSPNILLNTSNIIQKNVQSKVGKIKFSVS